MPSLIEDLRNPDRLPDKTENVSVVHTHISVVFVADHFVYKVKKPVNFGFLDFSTLGKRKYFCEQEIRLNRRLSKDLYIDVLPVMFDGQEHRLSGGPGEIVEYAVKMRRIPEHLIMKSIFQKGELTEEHLRKISKRLARFHANALRNEEIDRFGEPEKFRLNTDENFDQVRKYVGTTIKESTYNAIKRWTDRFYARHRDLFIKRIAEGKIRDCHGDLHMEHVCLTEDIAVIDCIEFNDRFRYSDVVADMAFLLMDLEYHGGESYSRILWDQYQDFSNEKDLDLLVTFYKVYRAFVRGKVNSFQIDDKTIGMKEREEAIRSAAKYFHLAGAYIA